MGSTSTSSKVALITGGASGIGLASARALAAKGWKIAIADLNAEAGEKVASELDGSFHRTNVTDYDDLAATFSEIWSQHSRLDFVFANAGIVEKINFYAQAESSSNGAPPKPNFNVLDINLVSVTYTTYLAQHFFRKNSTPGGVLLITASSGGLYPIPYLPLYAAAKAGCVNFTYSLASTFIKEGIRVNCICPGSVATGLLKPEEWAKFPQETFTKVEDVAKTVVRIVEDETIVGKAAEIIQDRTYFREGATPQDEALKTVMSHTKPIR